MPDLKPRGQRNKTANHIPIVLVNFLKNHAKDIMFTDQKIEITAGDRVLKLDPLWVFMTSMTTLADAINDYLTREDIASVEKQIEDEKIKLKEAAQNIAGTRTNLEFRTQKELDTFFARLQEEVKAK